MPTLRIISVNDVYSLENLPRLRSLVEHHRRAHPDDTLVVTLAGDFLAPSLLSSIDAGRGMVDCLNALGLTHVILGNHEDDLEADELYARLAELRPTCLWTNLRSTPPSTSPSAPGLTFPRHDIVEVAPGIRVGLVGVVMADPSVYRHRPFGGVELARANDAVLEESAILLAKGCTGVIPITHQSIADDRALAQAWAAWERSSLPPRRRASSTPPGRSGEGSTPPGRSGAGSTPPGRSGAGSTPPGRSGGGTPPGQAGEEVPQFLAIVGGHEHTPMLVDVDGTWIVKAGAEAVLAAVTELVWADRPQEARRLDRPVVTTRLEDVSSYPEDAALRARVDTHMAKVRELATATLLYVDPASPLSSIGTRSRQTSIGALICTKLRDALGAEACFFNGGGIRGSREYAERLTYGDIEAEVPFDNEVVVVSLPGAVIRDAIAVSREKAPLESGAFLQTDDGVVVAEGGEVVAIAGAPLEPRRQYAVAIVRELLLGLDHVEPLVRWAHAHPELIPPAGSGREPKVVLVQAFALGLWRSLGGFDALDTNKDDRVTPSELHHAIAQRHPSQRPSPILADILVRAIDADADLVITRQDAILREAPVAPARPPRAAEPED